ncbi:MAG: hypothetical protein KKF33_14125 [Alphaproteobacteria bacterium]|nr:hypothetical protein [Alphaproteobacteria bacterium]
MGLKGGLNTYGYAMGNPLKYIDQYGLEVTMTCRPLSLLPPGMAKPVHCAVIVWHWEFDKCGNSKKVIDSQYSLAGGGTGPVKPNGPMTQNESDTYNNDRNAFENPGANDTNRIIWPPAGTTQSDFDKAVTGSGNNYSQGPYRIPPTGNNSNTAADNIIENAGGTAPNIPGAWGQNHGDK